MAFSNIYVDFKVHELWKYIISQLDVVPKPVYEDLLTLFCIGAIVFLAVNHKEAARSIVWLLFFEFVFLVLGMTIFFRHTGTKAMVYPAFWSYVSVWRDGEMTVLHEIILNVVLFVPLGFLWGIQSSKWPRKWQWLSALILGVSLSVVIELLQYFFTKGCVEVDDVIHNTVGCLMGFVLWHGCVKWFLGNNSDINPK